LAFALFCISKKKYPETRTIIEKIDPIIESPEPVNKCLRIVTIPSLKPDIESKIDLDSPTGEDVAEIMAEIE